MEPVTPTTESYLTFDLGDEIFATNVNNVLEILEIPKITKVPRCPPFMRGVINLRGSVLPVIDARSKFGLGETNDTVNSCIMVLEISMQEQDIKIGAVVDAVQEVIKITPADILAAPSIGSKYRGEFIQGMVKCDEQFIMLLDLDKIFSADDTSILQQVAEA
ncbi:MAG TPA: chemotaxis protein CheW [Chryseosolibacter sp.]|nr:chemotaxis protein CheW [Chryseosolibacter sp.]